MKKENGRKSCWTDPFKKKMVCWTDPFKKLHCFYCQEQWRNLSTSPLSYLSMFYLFCSGSDCTPYCILYIVYCTYIVYCISRQMENNKLIICFGQQAKIFNPCSERSQVQQVVQTVHTVHSTLLAQTHKNYRIYS